MKLKTIRNQVRRDFWAEYECESCGHIEKDVRGYDDDNFHKNVMPNMKCKKCEKSTVALGLKAEEIKTKYNSWETV